MENTSIISKLSNQEEDEEEEDVPQGAEISDSDDEEPPPRGTKILSEIYQRFYFTSVEQENYKKTIKHDVWNKAMAEEIRMIEKINTWECVTIPKERKVVNLKWIYKTKLNQEGDIQENNLLTSSPKHFQEKSFAIFEKALELSSKCIKG